MIRHRLIALIDRFIDHGNGTLTLRIQDPFVFDSGRYSCTITTAAGDCNSECEVEVEETFENIFEVIPEFVKLPLPTVATHGSPTGFCARVTPVDSMVIWSVCGREITSDMEDFTVSSSICPIEGKPRTSLIDELDRPPVELSLFLPPPHQYQLIFHLDNGKRHNKQATRFPFYSSVELWHERCGDETTRIKWNCAMALMTSFIDESVVFAVNLNEPKLIEAAKVFIVKLNFHPRLQHETFQLTSSGKIDKSPFRRDLPSKIYNWKACRDGKIEIFECASSHHRSECENESRASVAICIIGIWYRENWLCKC